MQGESCIALKQTCNLVGAVTMSRPAVIGWQRNCEWMQSAVLIESPCCGSAVKTKGLTFIVAA